MWQSRRYLGGKRSETLRALNDLSLMKQLYVSLHVAYTRVRSVTARLGALVHFDSIVGWMS